MFGASLTNAQSNLSNEKLLFVKQKQEALMEKLIYLLFYGENILCWSSKLTVQLLMSVPASKWLMKALTASPCLSFEIWKLQLCWTFVKEGLTSAPCCCVVKTCIFSVLSAKKWLVSEHWMAGRLWLFLFWPAPSFPCPLLKPSALLLQLWLSQGICDPQLRGKRKCAHFPSSWKIGSLLGFTLPLTSSAVLMPLCIHGSPPDVLFRSTLVHNSWF